MNGLDSGRFLDGPEFTVIHDTGNEENVFDRVDFQASKADTIHMNLGYTLVVSDAQFRFDGGTGVTVPVGSSFAEYGRRADGSRSQIGTYNIAPVWTHILSSNAVFTAVTLSTAGPVRLLSQQQSVRGSGLKLTREHRPEPSLNNANVHSEWSYT